MVLVFSTAPCPRCKSPQAERQAVNTVCQGSAADIVKGAMLLLHAEVEGQEQEGAGRSPLAGNACMVLMVGVGYGSVGRGGVGVG